MTFSNRQRLILERLNRAVIEGRRVHQHDLETIPGLRTTNALINTLVSLERRGAVQLTWDEPAADRLVTIDHRGRPAAAADRAHPPPSLAPGHARGGDLFGQVGGGQ